MRNIQLMVPDRRFFLFLFFMALFLFPGIPALRTAHAATCQGGTAPCAEDPAIQACNVCHSIQIQGGNRNGTDRYITLSTGTFRHILDPAQADWTATVNSMISKGAAPADPVATIGYMNMNYCSTCTGVIMSGPAVVDITSASATITWSTSLNGWQDGPANSVVHYGTSPTSLTNTASDSTMTGSHSIALTGLNPSTKYYFQYQSTGANGVTVSYNFETPFFRTAAASGGGGTTTTNYAYVSELNSNSVSVVNVDKGTLDATVFLPGTPYGIAAAPNGSAERRSRQAYLYPH